MKPESAVNRWETLESKAHFPEVQAIIRREIFRGTIRVIPAPGGGIRIIPTRASSAVDEPERPPAIGLRLEPRKDHEREPMLHIQRLNT